MNWKRFVTWVGSLAALLTAIAVILSNYDSIEAWYQRHLAPKPLYGHVTCDLSSQDSVSGRAILVVHWEPGTGKHAAPSPVVKQAPIYAGALREKDREARLLDPNDPILNVAIPVFLQREKSGQSWSEVWAAIVTDHGDQVPVHLAEQKAARLPHGQIMFDLVSDNPANGQTRLDIRWEVPATVMSASEPVVIEAPILAGAVRERDQQPRFFDPNSRIWAAASPVILQRQKQGTAWAGVSGVIKTDLCPEIRVDLAALSAGSVIHVPPKFTALEKRNAPEWVLKSSVALVDPTAASRYRDVH